MTQRRKERVAMKATVKTEFGSFFVGDISPSGILLKAPKDQARLPKTLEVEILGECQSVKETLTPRWSKTDAFYWVGCQTSGDLRAFIESELQAQKSVEALDERLLDAEEFLAAKIQSIILLDEEREAIDEYQKNVGKRDPFLWHWVAAAFAEFALPNRKKPARLAQFYLLMLNAILDDIADERGNAEITKMACDYAVNGLPYHPRLDPLKNQVKLARKLFEKIRQPLEQKRLAPLFWPIIDYDIQQMRNNFIYSALSNMEVNFNSQPENRAMQHHNMTMVPFVMLELAHIDEKPNDLDKVRELLLLGSQMGRIGNTVSTWLRELNESDFTSLFFVLTAGKANRSLEDLKEIPRPTLEDLCQNNGVREELLEEWLALRLQARKAAKKVVSFDAHRYVEALDTLLKLQFGAVGRK